MLSLPFNLLPSTTAASIPSSTSSSSSAAAVDQILLSIPQVTLLSLPSNTCLSSGEFTLRLRSDLLSIHSSSCNFSLEIKSPIISCQHGENSTYFILPGNSDGGPVVRLKFPNSRDGTEWDATEREQRRFESLLSAHSKLRPLPAKFDIALLAGLQDAAAVQRILADALNSDEKGWASPSLPLYQPSPGALSSEAIMLKAKSSMSSIYNYFSTSLSPASATDQLPISNPSSPASSANIYASSSQSNLASSKRLRQMTADLPPQADQSATPMKNKLSAVDWIVTHPTPIRAVSAPVQMAKKAIPCSTSFPEELAEHFVLGDDD